MENKNITSEDLSTDQKEAYQKIIKWVNEKSSKQFVLAGYAGCGKTFLLSLIAKNISKSIAFACFTGKAALVLKSKLDAAGVKYSYCGTIHGLIYSPIIDPKTLKIKGWKKKVMIPEDLVFIDEASMVDSKIYRDLTFYGKKILFCGDQAQLPPISKDNFSIMTKPDFMLTEIHRQAIDNPIIKLSMIIRTGGDISNFKNDDDRVIITNKNAKGVDELIYNAFKDKNERLDSAMLCYFNASRVRYNNIMRSMLGYNENRPQIDDVVICLKNSSLDEDTTIFNGMRGLVGKATDKDDLKYTLTVNFPYDNMSLTENVSRFQFNDEKTFQSPLDLKKYGQNIKSWKSVGMLFDYGYALTYWKIQGSQYDNIFLFVERSKYQTEEDFRKAMYTSVTRSSNKLVVLI